MLCRAKASSVSQVGLDAVTIVVLFFVTGGVSFCSGVDRARGSYGEPKVTPPSLVYTPSDLTSHVAESLTLQIHFASARPLRSVAQKIPVLSFGAGEDALRPVSDRDE